jgi:hypothetical protein
MADETEIPVLTDLIEKGMEITMSDLGLDDEMSIETNDLYIDETQIEFPESTHDSTDPFSDNPALEQTVRRILDEHMELAWQEIKLAIQREIDRS